ncbi:Peptidoglycan/LPS O-acetylase OafA/YrhL, contains acyltransferase and SGNH-hydrolase domains [Nocardioides exalbidus]|uniref:Peptidoglycan/LPS O-acetylase OafA/YrhL, contains acyltransferase and SGNH-hydrolase domains n=1 Tax=Nocardioides exalbidus TaxID=402596 RepID=A0A1H4JFP6_9ACTN|nr:acyltransferase family protein [Nocardioides exalbidus]SEB44895.1 Peptidoglycan/LPS O-acetylase OafA/YrhL, contains acyltransferase and SGNH-hydrolase domains [Nocardioides exalbidus]
MTTPSLGHAVSTERVVGTEIRRDIQALRAGAVSMVVVYHFWPGLLPGGFVGVDVFFVISGYLITSHLHRHPPTSVRGFLEFWSRRVVRLLPAAAAAILGTLALVLVTLSSAEWLDAAKHAVTSMLYVENWKLISDATDYLRADAAPSPYQHFWSLSVEEQFYLAWPFVIGVAVLATRGRAVLRGRAMLAVVGVVTVVSFGYGLVLTGTNPPVAYFATPARMWELALGGVLALLHATGAGRGSDRSRTALAWLGVAGLAASCALITGTTPFPGWAALLPTLSAVALLHAGDPEGRFTLRPVMHARPVQLVGDVSYAAYLWHWPLVLLVPVAIAPDGLAHDIVKVALLPVIVLVAWISTFHLENPLRRVPPGGSLRRRALVCLVVCTGLVLGSALVVRTVVDRRLDAVQARVDRLTSQVGATPCLGAAALDPGADCDPDAPLVTTPDFARTDIPSTIRVGECLNWPPFADAVVSCGFGDTSDPTRKIALLGNSHAGHLMPPLEAVGEAEGWQVDSFVIGVCQPSVEDVPHPEPVSGVSPEQLTADCERLNQEALDRITSDGYSLVVMSTLDQDPAHMQWRDNIYRSTLATITDADVPVLVVRDTPASMNQEQDTPTCLGLHADDPTACDGTPQEWIRQDPLTVAAQRSDSPLVHRVDLNRHICTDTTCPAVVGGIITYADFNHLSATFSRTLAPYLGAAMLRALASG